MAEAANSVGGPLEHPRRRAAGARGGGPRRLRRPRGRALPPAIAHPALVFALAAIVGALVMVFNGIVSQASELREAASDDIDAYVDANAAASSLASLRVTEISAVAARGSGADLYAQFHPEGVETADGERIQPATDLLDALDEQADVPGVTTLRTRVADYIASVEQVETTDLAGDNQGAAELALSPRAPPAPMRGRHRQHRARRRPGCRLGARQRGGRDRRSRGPVRRRRRRRHPPGRAGPARAARRRCWRRRACSPGEGGTGEPHPTLGAGLRTPCAAWRSGPGGRLLAGRRPRVAGRADHDHDRAAGSGAARGGPELHERCRRQRGREPAARRRRRGGAGHAGVPGRVVHGRDPGPGLAPRRGRHPDQPVLERQPPHRRVRGLRRRDRQGDGPGAFGDDPDAIDFVAIPYSQRVQVLAGESRRASTWSSTRSRSTACATTASTSRRSTSCRPRSCWSAPDSQATGIQDLGPDDKVCAAANSTSIEKLAGLPEPPARGGARRRPGRLPRPAAAGPGAGHQHRRHDPGRAWSPRTPTSTSSASRSATSPTASACRRAILSTSAS